VPPTTVACSAVQCAQLRARHHARAAVVRASAAVVHLHAVLLWCVPVCLRSVEAAAHACTPHAHGRRMFGQGVHAGLHGSTYMHAPVFA